MLCDLEKLETFVTKNQFHKFFLILIENYTEKQQFIFFVIRIPDSKYILNK
jgi:hypothetical protein